MNYLFEQFGSIFETLKKWDNQQCTVEQEISIELIKLFPVDVINIILTLFEARFARQASLLI
jgi:hypothetical protein